LVARAAGTPRISTTHPAHHAAPVGEFIDVEITGTQVYDLVGKPV